MFGYVIANQEEMKIREYKRYRSYYCGLCYTLGRRFGQAERLALTYDMTFLAIVLDALFEDPMRVEQHRCGPHPLKKQEMLLGATTDYAADMSILLTYYNLLDDVRDDQRPAGRVASAVLKKEADRLRAKYPRQARALEEDLKKLAECEAANEKDLDTVAGLTGDFLGEIFVYREDDTWAHEMKRMGFYLGKYVYLLDAYDDLDKDVKKKNYNPWIQFMGRKDFDALVENTLTMMISECAKSFERLPIVQDVDILRNIIYSGVWTRFEAARKRREEAAEKKNRKDSKR